MLEEKERNTKYYNQYSEKELIEEILWFTEELYTVDIDSLLELKKDLVKLSRSTLILIFRMVRSESNLRITAKRPEK